MKQINDYFALRWSIFAGLVTFEVSNIPVAKFLSRTIVNSFLAHFIIANYWLSHSDIVSSPDHKVISCVCMFSLLIFTGSSSCTYTSIGWWSFCDVMNYCLLCVIVCALKCLASLWFSLAICIWFYCALTMCTSWDFPICKLLCYDTLEI